MMQNLNPNHPIKVRAINIKGNERTKEIFFEDEFSNSIKCNNINELHQHLQFVTNRLKNSGLFEAVETNININSPSSHDKYNSGKKEFNNIFANKNDNYDIDVNVIVKEVMIPRFSIGANYHRGILM